jgi:hypothetical protein
MSSCVASDSPHLVAAGDHTLLGEGLRFSTQTRSMNVRITACNLPMKETIQDALDPGTRSRTNTDGPAIVHTAAPKSDYAPR